MKWLIIIYMRKAYVVALVSGHHDVTVVTPGGGPAVLYDEEVVAVGGSVSDCGDTVVEELAGAVRLVVDSGGVKLEAHVRSV